MLPFPVVGEISETTWQIGDTALSGRAWLGSALHTARAPLFPSLAPSGSHCCLPMGWPDCFLCSGRLLTGGCEWGCGVVGLRSVAGAAFPGPPVPAPVLGKAARNALFPSRAFTGAVAGLARGPHRRVPGRPRVRHPRCPICVLAPLLGPDEAWAAVSTKAPLDQIGAVTSPSPTGWTLLLRVPPVGRRAAIPAHTAFFRGLRSRSRLPSGALRQPRPRAWAAFSPGEPRC